MKKQWGLILAVLVAMMAMVMGGCGGGGESGGVVSSTVSGVAAAGAPLVGTVKLKDSSSPAKELPGTINIDGSFSFNVDGLKPPFILKAQGTASGTNYTLYSFSSGPGTANINPLANLAVANAAGGADLAALYTTPSAATMQLIAANLAKSVADIQTKLQPMLTLYNATANPISDSYVANHLGLDGVLDVIKVDISATGTVTLTNKLTNAVIYTGSISNFTSGTLATANIPQPLVVVTATPTTATVTVNGTASFAASVFNSTNTQVIWSVVEAGGGTITQAGVYTAPSAEGTYHVKAASVTDSTKSATATVTVTSGPVSVLISPSPATVAANGTQTFTATVIGISNTQVSWSVVEPNGGSISQFGVYTAPATGGTYHVKAVSSSGPTSSATATVTVTAAVSPPTSGPFPIGTWTGPNGFSFTVNQSVGNDKYYLGTVNWGGLPGGTVDIQGNGWILNPSGSDNVSVYINHTSSNYYDIYSLIMLLTASSDRRTLTGTISYVSTQPGFDGSAHTVTGVFTKANAQPATTVSVAISPTSPTIAANGTQNFTASVTGTSNTQVIWSVVSANGGSITSGGVYNAPAMAGTYQVKALSVADPTKSAVAEIAVSANNTSNGSNIYLGKWIGPYQFSISITSTDASGKCAGQISYPAFNNGGIVQFSDNSASVYLDATGLSGLGSGLGPNSSGITNFGIYLLPVNGNQNQLKGELYLESSLAGYSHSTTSAIFNKQ